MQIIRTCVFLAVLALFCDIASADPTSLDELEIKEKGGILELTVPQSRVVLMVPKNGLTASSNPHGGAASNSRYFLLEDKVSGTVLSGWFEPAERYVNLENSWKQEMKGLKSQGFPPPEDVQRATIGLWTVIFYNIALPGGISSHLRASYVGSGTWIDLHASISSSQPREVARQRVSTLLSSIHLRGKS